MNIFSFEIYSKICLCLPAGKSILFCCNKNTNFYSDSMTFKAEAQAIDSSYPLCSKRSHNLAVFEVLARLRECSIDSSDQFNFIFLLITWVCLNITF